MRVLVVDDTLEIAQLLHTNLEHQGCTVSIVTANFETLLSPGPWRRVDVAIVDLMLPKVSGQTILDYLREHHPGIRRVVLSAAMSMLDKARETADFVFEKPINFSELKKAVFNG